jgi:hypothetical protein
MLLRCAGEVVPGTGAAFLIATVHLRVTAISEAAERIFGGESAVLGHSLSDLLESTTDEAKLGRAVAHAATRPHATMILPVRRRGLDAGLARFTARISTCGPPRAALVTLAPGDRGAGSLPSSA